MKIIFLFLSILTLSACSLFEKKEEFQSGETSPVLPENIEVQTGSSNR